MIMEAQAEETSNKQQRIFDTLSHSAPSTPTSTSTSTSDTPSSTPRRSPTLYDIYEPLQPENVTTKAAKAFVMNSLSHHIIENPYFVEFCMAVAATKGNIAMPTRQALRESVIKQGANEKKVISTLCF